MQHLFTLLLVAVILLPLWPIYRRKVSGKPVKGALLCNIASFFTVGLIMVGAPQAWRDIATGLVLIAAICLQLASKRSKKLAASA